MVKFCDVCGSPLNESGACPECDSAQKASSVKGKPANVVYLRHKTAAGTADSTADKEKNNILIPITAVMLALCVLSGGIFAAFSFNWFGLKNSVKKQSGNGGAAPSAADSSRVLPDDPKEEPDLSDSVYPQSQSQAFVRSSYGKITGGVNISEVRLSPCPEERAIIRSPGGKAISLQGFAADGDVFYGLDDEGCLRKITLTGANSADDEVFVSAEKMKSSVLGYSYEGELTFVKDLEDFTVDGDYIYARVAARDTFREKHRALNYRLVRINKDSGKIEFAGGDNVRAACFLASGGWIYYADNGYTYSVEKNSYSYSDRRVGLYKMRADGSDKVLLNGGFSGYGEEYKGERLGNACNLSLCGEKLYYLFLENGKSFLQRMNTDGIQNEKVSDISSDNYAVDVQNNAAYLRSGTYGGTEPEEHSLYRIDIETKTSLPMNIKLRANTNRMTVSGGYLYVDDSFLSFDNKRLKRIDITNGNHSVRCLLRQEYFEIALDKQTGLEKRIEKKSPDYRWTKYRGSAL